MSSSNGYASLAAPRSGGAIIPAFTKFAIVLSFALLAVSALASIFTADSNPYQWPSKAPPPYAGAYPGEWPPCTVSHTLLAQLRLSDRFSYACTPMQAVPTQPLQQIANPLPSKQKQLLWKAPTVYSIDTLKEANLNAVPARSAEAVQLATTLEQESPFGNEVVFGLASDAARIRERAKAISHWLSDTGALLLVSLPSTDSAQDTNQLKSYLSSLRINAKIYSSHESAVGRYFHLTRYFDSIKKPYHKWFIYIDDDTFFVSPGRLNKLLSKHDPNEMVYIGNLSEDWFQVKAMDELYACGGAGVITSRALQDELAKVYDECNANWDRQFGDYQVARCIYAHTNARLTFDYSMHQGDLKGNVGGLFESGRHFTSLHHWNSWWFNVDVTQMVQVQSKASAGSIGERFEVLSPNIAHQNTILTNGYSIVEYPTSTFKSIDFTKMERTWDNRTDGDRFFFDFNLGPLRYPLQERQDRFTHLMERAWTDEDHPAKPVHQLYVQRATQAGQQDSVVHLMWV